MAMATSENNKKWSTFLYKIGANLRKSDVEGLLLLFTDTIPGGKHERIKTGVQLIKLLEVDKIITADNITNLKSKLQMVGRSDLYDIAVAYDRNKAKDAEINDQSSNPRINNQNINHNQSIQDPFSKETTNAEINDQSSNPRINSQNFSRSQSIQDHFSKETTSKVCLTEDNYETQ